MSDKMAQWYLVDILDIKEVFTEVTLKILSDKKVRHLETSPNLLQSIITNSVTSKPATFLRN